MDTSYNNNNNNLHVQQFLPPRDMKHQMPTSVKAAVFIKNLSRYFCMFVYVYALWSICYSKNMNEHSLILTTKKRICREISPASNSKHSAKRKHMKEIIVRIKGGLCIKAHFMTTTNIIKIKIFLKMWNF